LITGGVEFDGYHFCEMENDMKLSYKVGVVGLVLAAIAAVGLFGQAKRTVVYTADVSVPGREAVITHVEIGPGLSAGRHTHPGDEMSYVVEGEADISMEGGPTRHVKTGDGFVIPANTKHDAHNTGTQTLKVIGVYMVEKGKPLATPAP
jgi:quercetin dioxygenase-like cupin family protein